MSFLTPDELYMPYVSNLWVITVLNVYNCQITILYT